MFTVVKVVRRIFFLAATIIFCGFDYGFCTPEGDLFRAIQALNIDEVSRLISVTTSFLPGFLGGTIAVDLDATNKTVEGLPLGDTFLMVAARNVEKNWNEKTLKEPNLEDNVSIKIFKALFKARDKRINIDLPMNKEAIDKVKNLICK